MDNHTPPEDIKYISTPDKIKIFELEGKHLGEEIVIMGNSPFLYKADAKIFEKYTVFGVNRTPEIMRCDYYLASDNRVKKIIEPILKVPSQKTILFIPYNLIIVYDVMNIFPNDKYYYYFNAKYDFNLNDSFDKMVYGYSLDPTVGLFPGCSCTYQATQLALFMGYRKIIFAGIDYELDKYDPTKKESIELKKSYEAQYKQMRFLIETTQRDIDGLKYYNANPKGRMDFCKRIKL